MGLVGKLQNALVDTALNRQMQTVLGEWSVWAVFRSKIIFWVTEIKPILGLLHFVLHCDIIITIIWSLYFHYCYEKTSLQ